VAILIFCVYEFENQRNESDIWLIMVQYLYKKFSDRKTKVDENLHSLSLKFLKRKNRKFIYYEVLYFIREINKLSEIKQE